MIHGFARVVSRWPARAAMTGLRRSADEASDLAAPTIGRAESDHSDRNIEMRRDVGRQRDANQPLTGESSIGTLGRSGPALDGIVQCASPRMHPGANLSWAQ